MNILFVGMYREGSGYGEASIRTMLALHAAGATVACRPMRFLPKGVDPPPLIKEFESRRLSHYDAVIQHCLPPHFVYDARCGLNVGMFYTETSPLARGWGPQCQLMDLILATHDDMATTLRAAGVGHVEVIPHPCDVDEYAAARPPSKLAQTLKEGGRFLFYTVGELVRRKNLSGLVRAFHAEFHPGEPVGLVLKTSMTGVSPEVVLQESLRLCRTVKDSINIYPSADHYIQEDIITSRLSRADLLSLHDACDCFVQPSFAEGWSLPAFDAMALGKTPIVTNAGAFPAYIDESVGFLVPARQELVSGEGGAYTDVFNGRQTWASPDLVALRRCMRQVYEDADLRRSKADRGRERARQFSYAAVGKRLLEALQSYGVKAQTRK